MAKKRKKILPGLERDLYMEAGWRCAVPTCRVDKPLEMAHISPASQMVKQIILVI